MKSNQNQTFLSQSGESVNSKTFWGREGHILHESCKYYYSTFSLSNGGDTDNSCSEILGF